MNLLELCDEQIVEKTNLSRKLTIGGKTAAYPVYRIRLDQLFYNDQNDRIATWITQYRNETGNVPLPELSREAYNESIERFIIDSNPYFFRSLPAQPVPSPLKSPIVFRQNTLLPFHRQRFFLIKSRTIKGALENCVG